MRIRMDLDKSWFASKRVKLQQILSGMKYNCYNFKAYIYIYIYIKQNRYKLFFNISLQKYLKLINFKGPPLGDNLNGIFPPWEVWHIANDEACHYSFHYPHLFSFHIHNCCTTCGGWIIIQCCDGMSSSVAGQRQN